MRPSKTAARLRRLLGVVPHVVAHPGVRIAELAAAFDVPEDELAEDLNLLFLCGLPPYGPGDLFEVTIETGRVWISVAEHLSRPVRLTRSEAVGLLLAGKALLGAPGLAESKALASGLGKIEALLGEETLGALAGNVEVARGEGASEVAALDVVRRAVAGQERLRVEYYGANRDEVTERDIEPEQVFAAIGNWYVAAWDVGADGERLFRVDRIRRAEPTGERFEPRGLQGAGRPLYTRSEEDIPVRLRLGPAARWVSEYFECEVEADRHGRMDIVLPTKDLAWVAKILLRLGGTAEVLSPPELAQEARALADETLASYRNG